MPDSFLATRGICGDDRAAHGHAFEDRAQRAFLIARQHSKMGRSDRRPYFGKMPMPYQPAPAEFMNVAKAMGRP